MPRLAGYAWNLKHLDVLISMAMAHVVNVLAVLPVRS